MKLEQFNQCPEVEARENLTRCCGSERFVDLMLAKRPFASKAEILSDAEIIWEKLAEEDWRQAFLHHPKIGDLSSLKEKYGNTKEWAAGEQRGAAEASSQTLEDLAAGNEAYEKKFGFIFIVCATGKSASEMLYLLKQRLPNDPQSEIKIAMREQNKITMLRLEKLLV
jgi:2-oxo-4-hydroxy-4-carboxy-5-ureidoimidazoline decarboxylase